MVKPYFDRNSKAHPQLPLNIKIRKEYSLANYIPDTNAVMISSLKNQLKGSGESCIYLWGRPGAGLSHLLQAACQSATENSATAIYLPMEELIELSPEMLKGIELLNLVCIDNIELMSKNPAWEEAVFHLFNQLQENQGSLLVAANATPQEIGIELADLVSRLASGVVYHVNILSDQGKKMLLQQRAKEVGLQLTEEATQYVLNRAERGVERLLEILARLDKASLSSGRKLTIPFIKETMGW